RGQANRTADFDNSPTQSGERSPLSVKPRGQANRTADVDTTPTQSGESSPHSKVRLRRTMVDRKLRISTSSGSISGLSAAKSAQIAVRSTLECGEHRRFR
ncbi:MAG: hypothetical protein KDI51_01210, partial [Xanthomonadales bacterium]|nr:hypothetical protein [Xanthomonadales bacterium]